MGALMNQGAAGKAAAGSLIFGGIGAGLNAAGAYASGSGVADQYNYQAQVAAHNAAITRANAADVISAGNYAESISKLRTGQTIASQKAAQAANGIDVNIGSAPATRQSSQMVGALDAAMIHYNAAKEAYGMYAAAENEDQQAALYRSAAKGAKTSGALKAATSLISSASSLSSRWNSYKLAFPGIK